MEAAKAAGRLIVRATQVEPHKQVCPLEPVECMLCGERVVRRYMLSTQSCSLSFLLRYRIMDEHIIAAPAPHFQVQLQMTDGLTQEAQFLKKARLSSFLEGPEMRNCNGDRITCVALATDIL